MSVGSMYQRRILKPMSLISRENASPTLTQSVRMNNAHYYSHRSQMRPFSSSSPPLPFRSIYSHHLNGHGVPSPSTDREKRKMTRWNLLLNSNWFNFDLNFYNFFPMRRRLFAIVLGISYAMFLVVFGAIVFIGDVIIGQYPLPQVTALHIIFNAIAA